MINTFDADYSGLEGFLLDEDFQQKYWINVQIPVYGSEGGAEEWIVSLCFISIMLIFWELEIYERISYEKDKRVSCRCHKRCKMNFRGKNSQVPWWF